MVIKAVVFDVGQTLSNQLRKDELQQRCERFYRFVHDAVNIELFYQTFIHLPQYPKEEFVLDLSVEVAAGKYKKEHTDVFTEYTLAQQILELLKRYESKHGNHLDFQEHESEQWVVPITEICGDRSQVDVDVYELWPDTIQTLKELKNNGLKIAIASNTSHPVKHEMVLDKLGINAFVDYCLISARVGIRKPNTQVLEMVAQNLGLQLDEIVMVGDMLDRDINMANQIQVKNVWINIIPYSFPQNLKRLKEGNPIYRPSAGICALSQLVPTIRYLEHGPNENQIRVGYYFITMKKKLSIGCQRALCSTPDIFYIPIELQAPIDKQGPFDALLIKVNDFLVKDDEETRTSLESLRLYIENHPETAIINPQEACEQVLRRSDIQELLTRICAELPGVRQPRKYTKDNVQFPCILKYEVSTMNPYAHKMGIATSQQGLERILEAIPEPYGITEFVRHSTAVHKVYVVGENCEYKYGASICPTNLVDGFLLFDSGKPWPEQLPRTREGITLDMEKLARINAKITDNTGMTIYGYDVLVEDDTNDYVIVDINNFPSLSAFSNLQEVLDSHILTSVRNHRNRN